MEKGRKDCDSRKTMHNGIFYVYREVAPVKSQQHWMSKQDLKIDISGHANENGGETAQVPTSTRRLAGS